MNFKLFLENELAGFVNTMLQNQDHMSRLITADWLEEKGDFLHEFLRLAKECGEHPDNDEICKQYDIMRNKVYEHLWTQFGVIVNFYQNSIMSKDSQYRIEGNKVTKFNNRKKSWIPVSVEKLSEGFLRAVIALLGYKMGKGNEKVEHRTNFQRANKEFHDITQAIENRIRHIGDQVPAVWLKRMHLAIDHVLSTLQGADTNDKLNLFSHLNNVANYFILYRVYPNEVTFLQGVAQKIHKG